MKILLVTDAWQPQVNGVVTTLVELVRQLKRRRTLAMGAILAALPDTLDYPAGYRRLLRAARRT